ncbi:hypothetical protein L1S32_07540 [Methanogenium sp. S4BF]|uniref:hypothetical protein n=1 Tax=Methanogenium sp. S4BF TaxID=1789226 RepID=UPI002417498A|nr:hypothetical protein [Methanogenium sp. S4BF]WFN33696.1 hypothetical protein L1S32_07540 [Methanogenium sp. S4BF]
MTDRSPVLRDAAIGIGAGIVITGLIHLFPEGWMHLSSYNQTLLGMGIIHMYASLLLVLFFAGCMIPFVLHTDARQPIILHAALTGIIAAGVARVLPFIGKPVYILSSLLSTMPQLFVILACGMLVSASGGCVASAIRREEEGKTASLVPVAVAIIAVIVLPPLLAAAGVYTAIISPAPYTGGSPGQSTDLRLLKLSPDGSPEWEETVDISTYDGPDALAEFPDGYLLTATEYSQEYNTIHLIRLDGDGNHTRLSAIQSGFSPVTSIVPTPDGGFLLATETPEIMHITTTGEVLWTRPLSTGSQGQGPVSLLARDDGTFVAAWTNRTACLDANGTILWDVSPDTIGSGPSFAVLTEADNGGVLVCTEGKHIKADNQYTVYPVAVRLDADGTIQWEKSFGNGNTDTVLGTWQNENGHTILYRTTTFPKDLWGNVVQAYTSHLISLSDDGAVTGLQEVPDTGGDVIPSPSGGYLSPDTGETTITGTAYDTGGQVIWTEEYDIQANPYSLRGIGTADGGYLIAVSSPS